LVKGLQAVCCAPVLSSIAINRDVSAREVLELSEQINPRHQSRTAVKLFIKVQNGSNIPDSLQELQRKYSSLRVACRFVTCFKRVYFSSVFLPTWKF